MPKQLDVQNFFKIWHIGYSNHKDMFKEIKNGGQKMYRLLFFVTSKPCLAPRHHRFFVSNSFFSNPTTSTKSSNIVIILRSRRIAEIN